MTPMNQDRQPDEPVHSYQFDGAEIAPCDDTYSELQKAVMPLVGVADQQLTPLGSCFSISASMNLIVTAWHVVDSFIGAHHSSLEAGTARLDVLYETADEVPGRSGHIGCPLPVYSVSFRPGLDLVVMRLWDVTSDAGMIRPTAVSPIGFGPPPTGDYCYGFGYPVLSGGRIQEVDGKHSVHFSRALHQTGGKVVQVYANGNTSHLMVPGPHFDCDSPLESGMSGGPVLTDTAGVCGLMSASLEPSAPGERWASFVSLLSPLLGYPVHVRDADGSPGEASIYDLIGDGHISTNDGLHERPPTDSEVQAVQFGRPRL